MKSAFWNYFGLACLGAILVVILGTFEHYGMTWDEPLCRTNGYLLLSWYKNMQWTGSGITTNLAALHTLDLYLYGAFYDSLSYLTSLLLPFGVFESAHLFNAMFGWLSLVVIFFSARKLSSPLGGVVALMTLALTPHYYGHMFNNPKDIPFATTYLCAVYFLLKHIDEFPRISRKTSLLLGLSAGASMAIRIGGGMLLVYLLMLWLLWLVFPTQATQGSLRQRLLPWFRLLFPSFSITLATAWAVMILFWPYAQVSPLIHPFKAILGNAHFEFNPVMLFSNQVVYAKTLPWNYLYEWFLIRLPYTYGVMGLGALCLLPFFFAQTTRTQKHQFFLLLTAVVFPLLLVSLLGSTLYDGIRHFLFIIPPLVLLLVFVIQSTRAPFSKLKAGLTALWLACCGLTTSQMIQLHPYQSVFFNHIKTSTFQQKAQSYDFDYWGQGFLEAYLWVKDQHQDKTLHRPLRIAGCGHCEQGFYWIQDSKHRDSRFEYVGPREDPDYLLNFSRYSCNKYDTGEQIHTISRLGAPLIRIFKTHKKP